MENMELQCVTFSAEYTEVRPHRRDHTDPTADSAIPHLLRVERRQQWLKKASQNRRPRVGVWRHHKGGHR